MVNLFVTKLLMSVKYIEVFVLLMFHTGVQAPKVQPSVPMSQSQVKAMEDLDVLGETLMQQNITDKPKHSFPQR